MFGLPTKVSGEIGDKVQELEKLKEFMTKAMEQEQIDFNEALEVAINTVGSFSNYQNHDQYIANAETAENVMSKI